MTTSRLTRGLVLGAVAALAVGISALPGASQETPTASATVTAVSGHATGVFVDLELDEDAVDMSGDAGPLSLGDATAVGNDVSAAAFESFIAGPAPTVTLPPEGGGPFTDELASLELEALGETADLGGPLSVSTEGTLGPDGRAASSARVENFNPDAIEVFAVTAGVVEVECTSDLVGGPVGTTRITDGQLEVPPNDESPIAAAPAPNTVVFEGTFNFGQVVDVEARVVANEQTVGANDITVRGLHATLTISVEQGDDPPVVFETVETIVGEVSCGVVPGAVLEPTFTG